MNTAQKLSGTKVYWHRNYANGKGYSGLPVGDGTYVRLVGWLTPTGGDASVPRYDLKVGKGTSDGDLTRIKGTNQSLHPKEFAWIPESPDDNAHKLEGKLRNYFVENGWERTDEEKYNIRGVEHVHKQFNSKEDDKLAIAEIESLICSFFNTPPAPKLSFREIQKDAINHMIKALEAGHYCLALAIATGGGKTILGLQFLIQLRRLGKIKNGDAAAMVSPNKDAQQSFIADANKFYPDDFNIIKQDELLSGKLAKDKINLLLVGTKWLTNGPEDSLNYDLLCNEYRVGLSDIKAFVFDEAHRAFFGKNKTNQTEKIAKEIMSHNPYTLWLSGTAATLLANLRKNGWLENGGEFCFTLAQLLADLGYVDSDLPELQYHVLSELPEFPDENIEDLLTMDKLLDNENCFQLQKFLENVFFTTRGAGLLKKHRHIVVSVNKQKQVSLVKNLLDLLICEKYPHFKDVNIVPVTGSDSETVTDLEDYGRKIQNCDQSITITCSRWLEAVNVPRWDTLLLMNKIETYEWNFQAYGRLLRVFEGKRVVQIYDCSPKRYIEFFHNLREELQAASQKFAEWDYNRIYSLVPVFFHDVNFKKTELDFQTFEEKIDDYISSISTRRILVEESDIKISAAGLAFKNINVGTANSKSILMKIVNGLSGKDVERTIKQINEIGIEVDNQNNKLKLTKKNIKKAMKFFMNVQAFLSCCDDIESWDDLVNYKEKDSFKLSTHVELDTFVDLVYNGLVSIQKMEEVIKSINLYRT